MKKSDFDKIEKNYLDGRKRLENIVIGSLVWEEVGRFGDNDYHPAVVKSVNVDEDYIEVIDVSDKNQEKKYYAFVTATEMISRGFSKESIYNDYQRYAEIIRNIGAK